VAGQSILQAKPSLLTDVKHTQQMIQKISAIKAGVITHKQARKGINPPVEPIKEREYLSSISHSRVFQGSDFLCYFAATLDLDDTM
jgi:hypothetical protein